MKKLILFFLLCSIPAWGGNLVTKYFLCDMKKMEIVPGWGPYLGDDEGYLHKTGCGYQIIGRAIDPTDGSPQCACRVVFDEADYAKINAVAMEITEYQASCFAPENP